MPHFQLAAVVADELGRSVIEVLNADPVEFSCFLAQLEYLRRTAEN